MRNHFASLLLLIFSSFTATSQGLIQKQKEVSPERSFLERFGSSAVISGDFALLSSYNNTDADSQNYVAGAGAVFSYQYDGNQWKLHQKIVENNRLPGNRFGHNIKINERLAAIASARKLHIYELNAKDSWVSIETINIDSIFPETSIEDFSLQQGQLAISFHSVIRGQTSLLTIFEPDPLQADTWKMYFQDSVRNILFVDNSTWSHSAVVASAKNQVAYKVPGDTFNGQGFNLAIHVYQKTSSWQKSQILKRSDQDFDFFGAGKDMAMNDSFIFEGHSLNNTDAQNNNPISRAGAVYIYKNNNGTYQFTQKITSNRRRATQFFGHKLATESNYLLVGAAFEHYDSEEKDSLFGAGAVYLFHYEGCIWKEVAKITANDRIARHGYGWSLDFYNNKIVIGSNDSRGLSGQNNLTQAGAVYFYEFEPSSGNQNRDTLFICDTTTSPSGKYRWYNSGLYLDELKDIDGCDSSIAVQVILKRLDSAQISASPLSMCLKGNQVRLLDSSSKENVLTSQWVFPDGNTADKDSLLYQFSTEGEKRVWRIKRNEYCQDSSSVLIWIFNNPSTITSISPNDTQCLEGNEFTFTAKVEGGKSPYSFNWLVNGVSTSQESFKDSFDAVGSFPYQLIIVDSNGCADTVNQFVWVEECPEPSIFSLSTFNTFTPNNDGFNDFFDIPIENEIYYRIAIYNRNGTLVFSSEDSNIDWNGKLNNSGGDLTEGTYYYYLEYQESGKNKESLFGVVNLLR